MPVAPAAGPKKTSPILIVFIVLAALVLIGGGLITAGIWYAAHRAREIAREYNIPTNRAERMAMREGRESINACSLASKADAEAVLGASIESTSGDGTNSCLYMPADGGRHVRIQVTPQGGKLAMKLLQKTVSLMPGAATVGDLGDGALMAPMDSALYVLKGDTLIAMEWPDTPGRREQKEALAKKILARL